MRLFTRTLDTVLEAEQPTANLGPPPDPAGATATYHGPAPGQSQNVMGTAAQWQEVEKMREQAKAQKLGAMSVDQKIDLALQQAANAERTAYRTARDVSAIDAKLDKILDSLPKAPQSPDPPGSSIWDDDEDPESIFGR